MIGFEFGADEVKKAAMAVAISYFEKRNDDRAAKSALQKALPGWPQDRVDGFLRRQKEQLKRSANSFQQSIDSVVSDEKRQEDQRQRRG